MKKHSSIAPRTIVLTGASSGIGAEAARLLSQRGHRILVVGRDPEKTADVAGRLGVEGLTADYNDLSSVVELAANIKQRVGHIDVLANNAGGIFEKGSLSAQGLPKAYQVNYLAGWLLTEHLVPELAAGVGLVVNTASMAARLFSDVDPADITGRDLGSQTAYGNAKLLNILHAAELTRRHSDRGIFGVSFHPGVIASHFAHNEPNPFRALYSNPVTKLAMTKPRVGAQRLAFHAEATIGVDVTPGQYSFHTRRITPPDQALDRKLWDLVRRQSAQDAADFLPSGQ
ncbi:SDR family NAD(P)-dependent oxidoreductase [Corynebacterium aquilae]|uniref:Short-chain dehydrogenase n=1 Tax=Corynebacterium aquilae DSM 44791 TaxID=1431546 RepID=A0A1L7CEI9_9CORY|nr:SDR family NAD(P)-dependent oxidoreductase [Corynebacterium aquilae]APT84261.1 hypothetical protein CAQU_03345 [Corynebacterium aquilae DSM 44791]